MRFNLLYQHLFQCFSKHLKHDIPSDTMIHCLNNSGTLHIDSSTKSALLKELPDFRRKCTKLSWKLEVNGNEFGIIADDLIGTLRIFDGILTLKEFLHREYIERLILEFLDISISWFAR